MIAHNLLDRRICYGSCLLVKPLANFGFATKFIFLSEKKRKKKPEPVLEGINEEIARVLDLALITMSEERHIIEDDREHYNPWDHLEQIYTGGFEHEGGMTGDQKRFYKEFGIQLEILKKMEEAKPPAPCTTIQIEIEGEKTVQITCPTRRSGW
ncbi:hypothetical protein SLS59_002674 [Nothophoma quercina]|uniref:Uncharacterized protein n=1 Tax=Nothophoma quercina TaxID=749835 RepID=A0ABR3RSS1_9PLEO